MPLSNYQAKKIARDYLANFPELIPGTFPMQVEYNQEHEVREFEARYIVPGAMEAFVLLKILVRDSGEVVLLKDRIARVKELLAYKKIAVPDATEKRLTPAQLLRIAFDAHSIVAPEWFLRAEFEEGKKWPYAVIKTLKGHEFRICVTAWPTRRNKANFFANLERKLRDKTIGIVITQSDSRQKIQDAIYHLLGNMRANGLFR